MAVDLEFLKQLRKLNLLARKRVMSSYAGGQKSVKQGKGIEAVDYRQYFPGDDIRFVDWKLYARTEKLFIKRFEEEKSLVTHVLVDCSKSMDFSSNKISKFDYASMMAAGFMYLVSKENEKFGFATYNQDIENVLQPKRGRKHLFNAIDLLNYQKLSGKTDFGTSMEKYSSMIKSRSLIIIISDFLENLESIKTGIFRAAKKTRNLILVHIADPMELNLDWQGDIRLIDLETNELRKVYFSPDMRRRYQTDFENHLSSINGFCDDVGADFFSIRTDMPIYDAFFDITKSRIRAR